MDRIEMTKKPYLSWSYFSWSYWFKDQEKLIEYPDLCPFCDKTEDLVSLHPNSFYNGIKTCSNHTIKYDTSKIDRNMDIKYLFYFFCAYLIVNGVSILLYYPKAPLYLLILPIVAFHGINATKIDRKMAIKNMFYYVSMSLFLIGFIALFLLPMSILSLDILSILSSVVIHGMIIYNLYHLIPRIYWVTKRLRECHVEFAKSDQGHISVGTDNELWVRTFDTMNRVVFNEYNRVCREARFDKYASPEYQPAIPFSRKIIEFLLIVVIFLFCGGFIYWVTFL